MSANVKHSCVWGEVQSNHLLVYVWPAWCTWVCYQSVGEGPIATEHSLVPSNLPTLGNIEGPSCLVGSQNTLSWEGLIRVIEPNLWLHTATQTPCLTAASQCCARCPGEHVLCSVSSAAEPSPLSDGPWEFPEVKAPGVCCC